MILLLTTEELNIIKNLPLSSLGCPDCYLGGRIKPLALFMKRRSQINFILAADFAWE